MINSYHTSRMNRPLDDEQLNRIAPSIFADQPWRDRSERYRFVPTINVVNALRDAGYFPVKAMQSRSRIPGKGEFTKHMIRFRSKLNGFEVNDTIPEIVLINSHDGTSAYKMMMGLFRLVCSNGLVVADKTIDSIHVRHVGDRDLCQEVIDVSGKIIEEAPKTIDTMNRWGAIELNRPEQLAFANAAAEVYETAIDVQPERWITARRFADQPKQDGSRDLWKTYNVIQENMLKGGLYGRNSNGRRTSTRQIKSVDRDVKLNRALWTLTEQMEALKTGAAA